jgi:O-acetyl-ADP-ribose deacetylase (regulator of RNase III)
MLIEKTVDIFEAQIDILVHQCNCFHTFGGGIARVIADKFPEAFDADLNTPKGDPKKMGTLSLARVNADRGSQIDVIVNLYGQFKTSSSERMTSYDALDTGLRALEQRLVSKGKQNMVVGVPYQLGSGLGGGNWNVVKTILSEVFDKSPVHCMICRREED